MAMSFLQTGIVLISGPGLIVAALVAMWELVYYLLGSVPVIGGKIPKPPSAWMRALKTWYAESVGFINDIVTLHFFTLGKLTCGWVKPRLGLTLPLTTLTCVISPCVF